MKNREIKIWLIIGIIALVLLIGIYGFYGITRNSVNVSEENKVKLGAILPLSGDLAFIGEEIQRGMELAKEEAKEDGIDIRIIYGDDQSFSATAAVNAANKLINIDKIDVGITAFIEEAKPIAPIFNDKEVPLIVVWDSNKFIQEGGDYLFSTGFSTEKAGEKMATFAYQELGLREIAIVSHIDAWAEIISESFQDKFESLGGAIVRHEKHQTTEEDYRTTIAKIKLDDPDAVYFPLIPPTSINFLIQAKQLGLEVDLLSGDALIQDVIDGAGSAAEEIYYTNIFTTDAEELIARYKEKYGADPIDITLVSFGYEGINAIKEAVSYEDTNLRDGLVRTIGVSRTVDRAERIYKVVNGISQLVK